MQHAVDKYFLLALASRTVHASHTYTHRRTCFFLHRVQLDGGLPYRVIVISTENLRILTIITIGNVHKVHCTETPMLDVARGI